MAPHHKCSLIITVYNQAKQLRLILLSALQQTERNFEIIVADDGSSDHVADVIQEFQSQLSIKHVPRVDEGHRKTLALNGGVKAAESPYLIVIDGDMILHHRFIEMHLKYAQPDKVMCGWRGCKIKEPVAKKLMESREDFSTTLTSILWRTIKGEIEAPFRTLIIENSFLRKLFVKEKSYVGGCNFALSKSNYELCNGMDESIKQFGYEDIEIGQRLKNNGITPASVRSLANTFHLEHPKKPCPAMGNVRKNVVKNRHKKCKYGLEELDEGSTNEMFIKSPEE